MIEARNLKKTFVSGEIKTPVLKGIDLKVEDGEFIAIMGRSGAGKSTLLYQMSLLDDPTEGEIIVDGNYAHNMPEDEKILFRLMKFGYVFQDYALLPELTALENVALPLLMKNLGKEHSYREARAALLRVGVVHRLNNLPSQLSGGEQQRVSIARAIAHNPNVLFADEPTANLDNESSHAILEIFRELHQKGQTIIMVTHEEEFATEAGKIVLIDDGKIVGTQKH